MCELLFRILHQCFKYCSTDSNLARKHIAQMCFVFLVSLVSNIGCKNVCELLFRILHQCFKYCSTDSNLARKHIAQMCFVFLVNLYVMRSKSKNTLTNDISYGSTRQPLVILTDLFDCLVVFNFLISSCCVIVSLSRVFYLFQKFLRDFFILPVCCKHLSNLFLSSFP